MNFSKKIVLDIFIKSNKIITQHLYIANEWCIPFFFFTNSRPQRNLHIDVVKSVGDATVQRSPKAGVVGPRASAGVSPKEISITSRNCTLCQWFRGSNNILCGSKRWAKRDPPFSSSPWFPSLQYLIFVSFLLSLFLYELKSLLFDRNFLHGSVSSWQTVIAVVPKVLH